MGKLTRTETVCLAAAAVSLALAVGVRLTAPSGEPVSMAPADRSQAVWTENAPVSEDPARPMGLKIDINSADADTLALLPGVGEVLAGRIIGYREENGAFAEISDIMAVEGIGPGTFDKIKDYITAEEIS